MYFNVYYELSDGTEDDLIIGGETIEELRELIDLHMELRRGRYLWSSRIDTQFDKNTKGDYYMKFFIITRDDYDYDEYDTHVVRAENKEDVLNVCGDEDFTKENSTIKEVTLEGGAEIISSSFNAG